MMQASSGLYVFKISDMDFLKRFLITGSTGSVYIGREEQLSQHIGFLAGLAGSEVAVGERAVDLIEEISVQGRAAKNDSALFALAVLATSTHVSVRQRAYRALPKVARTSTHLFMLMGFLKEIRGFGRGLRKAINGWYLDKSPMQLAYQIAKYRNREGWSHRDIMRVVRPKADVMSPEHKAIIGYAVHSDDVQAIGQASEVSPVISAYEEMKRLPNDAAGMTRGMELIVAHGLPHEVVPNDWKSTAVVWEAMLPSMNPEALMRNLGRMTHLQMFNSNGQQYLRNVETVRSIFSEERLRSARLHPLKIYVALKAYSSGKSSGNLSWEPNRIILDILNTAFYSSFAYAPRTGKNIYVGMDVSGSMGMSKCYQGISCIEGAAIMARAITSVESNFHVGAFANTMVDATHIFQNPKDTIKQTADAALSINWGSTDLSLPLTDAMTNPKLKGIALDAFVLFTDNEVNHGRTHPRKLLEDYRERSGKATRFIVVGMTANQISIADPKDPFMLDIGGFDASVPKLVSEFIAG
jgi:60 kDa SS-A/Ro ribonucleoprotein